VRRRKVCPQQRYEYDREAINAAFQATLQVFYPSSSESEAIRIYCFFHFGKYAVMANISKNAETAADSRSCR